MNKVKELFNYPTLTVPQVLLIKHHEISYRASIKCQEESL